MERQKPCKYCDGKGSYDILNYKFKIPILGVELELYNNIIDNKMILGINNEVWRKAMSKGKKINFCPMCGRKLKTEGPRK